MTKLIIQSQKKKEIIDITEKVQNEIKTNNGFCHLFVLHTTAVITTADLDPGTDLDMLDAFEKIIPKLNYRHPHNPAHAPDHILSSLIGPSLMVPVTNGKLTLGAWQRIILVELDGPRNREIAITLN